MHSQLHRAGLAALVLFTSSAYAVEPQPGDILAVGPDVPKIEHMAALGDPSYQAQLGGLYLSGTGVPKDTAKAIDWFHKAALQDYDKAEYALGMIYSLNPDTPHDYPQAAVWFHKAVVQGNMNAAVMLGALYEQGMGVPQSDQTAMGWYKMAADRDIPAAQYALAYDYYTGKGSEADRTQMLPLLQRAADQGFMLAEALLGGMYLSGRLVPKDETKAVELLHKSIAQGSLSSQCTLANYYLQSTATADQIAQARRWLEEGATKGGIQAAECLNTEAWILATAADPVRRDSVKAIQYATEALAICPTDSGCLDTMAAAYAAAGQYDQAVAEQQKAIAAWTPGPKEEEGRKQEMQARLDLYRAHKPYVDPTS